MRCGVQGLFSWCHGLPMEWRPKLKFFLGMKWAVLTLSSPIFWMIFPIAGVVKLAVVWAKPHISHNQRSKCCNSKAEERKLKELHRQDLTTVPWSWTCHLSLIQARNVGHVGCFLPLGKGPMHAASTVLSKPASRTMGWHRMALGLPISSF